MWKCAIDLSSYLVTHRGTRAMEEFYHIVRESAKGGVTVVQLRDDDPSTQKVIAMGKELHSFLRPMGIPLIINDRVDIAPAIGAEGVHLGQSDLSVSQARAILGWDAIIGLSVENMDQAFQAEEEPVNYIAASPVFPSTTKLDCAPPWGLAGLKRLCSFSRHPVVAIGGINNSNAKEIAECGAAGVALVSAIFNAACPRTAANEIHRSFYGM
ncbi:MAG: thiamine phosphate synthase [Chlamydiota bacterium]